MTSRVRGVFGARILFENPACFRNGGCLFCPLVMDNGWVIPRLFLLLLALVSAPGVAAAQSFTVNGPFNAGSYKPLDGQERWSRWWSEDGAGPAIHVQSITAAAYWQVINDPTVWHRTGGGFIRRVGSAYGENLIQNSTHEAFAAAAGTDPRYFACGCKGFFRRSGHALKMTLFTYTHGGHETLDVPQLAGAYGGAMIEATWWPHHYSALAQGVQAGHIEVGFVGAVHLAQEFAPEFKRMFHIRGASGGAD